MLVPAWLLVGLCVFGHPDQACWVLCKYIIKRKSDFSVEISWPQIREAEMLSVNDRLSLGEA